MTKRFLVTALTVVTLLAGLAAPSEAGHRHRGDSWRYSGAVVDLDTTTDAPTDGARARLVIKERRGYTFAFVYLSRLGDGLDGPHPAHLHVGPCVENDPGGTGGHYQNEPGGAVDARNELWLPWNPWRGRAWSFTAVRWEVRDGEALSVVFHYDPDGPDGDRTAEKAGCVPVRGI